MVFVFNDKLYYWVLKPVSKGYSAVLPKDIRGCLGNFFSNLTSPVVLINTLLQGRFEDAGTVLSRFGINTVIGVFGLADPAAKEFDPAPSIGGFWPDARQVRNGRGDISVLASLRAIEYP